MHIAGSGGEEGVRDSMQDCIKQMSTTSNTAAAGRRPMRVGVIHLQLIYQGDGRGDRLNSTLKILLSLVHNESIASVLVGLLVAHDTDLNFS